MCGPLAVAGCARGGRIVARDAIAYHLGRLLSYSAMGALCGALGAHALCILPLATLQTIALVLVSLLAAVKGIRALWPRREAGLLRIGVVRPARRNPGLLARLLPRRGGALGLATGLLPCGMLVPAWMLAASSGGSLPGALAMAAFCAASMPSLLVPLLGGRLLARAPRRLAGIAWCALAIFVAIRPLFMAAHHHAAAG